MQGPQDPSRGAIRVLGIPNIPRGVGTTLVTEIVVTNGRVLNLHDDPRDHQGHRRALLARINQAYAMPAA